MLGKVCLKRLRFVLYAVLFFLLTLDITNRTGSGLIATVCIWLALPLAFVVLVWWIYACVRDTVRLLRDGVAPEDTPTWAEYAVWWVQDELAEIASLDERGKARYFLCRVGGVLLGALGLVLIVRDSVVLGTLLLIAGLMKEFMAATFTDLILRVGLAIALSKALGAVGVWCAWPIGWSIAMVMSVRFYRRGPWEKA